MSATMQYMGRRKDAEKKDGRARELGSVVPINIELPPDIGNAIESYKERTGATKRWIVTRALEEFLAKAGLWPPSPPRT